MIKYYHWLVNIIGGEGEYSELLKFLFDTEFIWIIDGDYNRAADGEYLRRVYKGKNTPSTPCSMLEMMVALSVRIEDDIMYDPQFGDRTAQWFWSMIENMGLLNMKDGHFNPILCNEIVHNIMTRKGKKDLFFCSTFSFQKWNKLEIWQKMCAWLNQK
mgnify:CR=1 FL=1